MNDDPATVDIQEVDKSGTSLSEALTQEEKVLEEALAGEEEVGVPQVRVFSDKALVASIILKPHSDEPSYRNALIEVAIVLPQLAVTAASFWFKTADDRYGIIYVSVVHGIGGCFFEKDGSRTNFDNFRAEDLDTETVMVLDRFVNTPSDASYVNEAIHTLRKRGHQITIHSDLDKLSRVKL